MLNPKIYKPKNHIRIVTAASLFDGHDAAINIFRRIIQATGAEVIHLGHDRSVSEIVDCAIQEDAQAIALTSYQGGHMEYFKYMKDMLQERGCGHIKIFGGGGGVILPDLHLGRDAPLAVVLTLQHLLEFGGSMRDLFLSLPQYKIVKHKISIEGLDPDDILNQMAGKHNDKKIDFLDGLKIDDANTWIHLRKSNTEPIIRIMAEAPTSDQAEALAETYLREIRAIAG